MALSFNGKEVNKICFNNNVGYTKVGNPTIVDGVASGFSSGNYVKPASNVPFSRASSWEFVSRFQIEANTTGSHFLADFAVEAKGFNISATSKSLFWELGNASASNWQYSKTISYTFDPTIFYSVKLSFDGNLYSIWLKTDTTQWTKLDEYASTTGVGTSYYNAFGYSIRFRGRGLNGSIDLNSTYIKVNGITWFSGKQQASKDVNYVIKDGKLVWANPNLYLSNEYIDDNTICPFINTGIPQSSNSDIECILYTYNRTTAMNNCAPFGCWQLEDDDNKIYAPTMFCHWNNVNDVDFCFGSSRYDGKLSYNEKHKVLFSDKNYFIDGVLQKQFTDEFENKGNTTLFALSIWYGTKFSYTSYSYAGRIYSCKLWNQKILVRHFVPVPAGLKIGNYTVPANGMWDIVTQQFFGNSGTGDFTIGRD